MAYLAEKQDGDEYRGCRSPCISVLLPDFLPLISNMKGLTMIERKPSNIAGFLLLPAICLLMSETAFAERLWPMQLGQTYTFNQSNPSNDTWAVTVSIDGYVTHNSQNYFHLAAFNYENSSAAENWGYVRSAQNCFYSSPGDDFIDFQKAPVGTKWIIFDEDGEYTCKVIEIVAIEPITVPYGTFSESYKHCKYYCVDPDNLSLGKSGDWFEWIVPGVGWVKQEDYNVSEPGPVIMELTAITQNSDLTGDTFVRLEDFAVIAKWWLDDCDTANDFCDGADFDLSGQVSLVDLLTIVQNWQHEPVPQLDYSGDYECDLPDFDGYIMIQQNGCHADIYLGYDGPYAGIVNGNVINITLNDDNNVGTMQLVFSSEGDSFTATYDIEGAGAGSFNGWLTEQPGDEPDIRWVYINDPGVSGHEGFNGYMSKYETTHAQYAQYLNAALISGDVTVNGNSVVGSSGSNSGTDFTGQSYYVLNGSGYTYNGALRGGAARIHWTGRSFTVDAGFENHPVTHVSWYGATAFAGYYGWRLPTEWEWQAVADYNGTFTYGCGTTIDNSKANYAGSVHPYGTTRVGHFGAFGYGLSDLSGNVFEWTSSIGTSGNGYRTVRGGSWQYNVSNCAAAYRYNYGQSYTNYHVGFRVCR
jgi:hypothetical protein